MKLYKILLFVFTLVITISAQWTLPANSGITDTYPNSPTLVAGDTYLYLDGAYRSSDGGGNWEPITKPLENNRPTAQIYFDGKLFTGHNTSKDCIYYTSDHGDTWQSVQGGPSATSINVFHTFNGNIYALVPGAVYKSSDSGLNWEVCAEDLGNTSQMITHKGNLYLSSFSGVLKSTDDGETWAESNNGITNQYGDGIWSWGDKIYFKPQGGLYLSTDEGNSWSNASLDFLPTYSKVQNVMRIGSHVYIRSSKYNTSTAINEHSLFYASDSDSTWQNITENLPIENMGHQVAEFDGYLFTAFWSTTDVIYKRQLSTTTAVENDKENLQKEFTLSQNFPNPFNPTTNIQYQVTSNENVSLVVYNLLGQQVATLVNEQKSPGVYEIQFDASNLSSGIYLYKLISGNQVTSRKMILIK